MRPRVLTTTILFIIAIAAATACTTPATSTPSPRLTTVAPASTTPPEPQPPADLWRDPVPAAALETKQLLQAADPPQRDLVDLTARLTAAPQPVPHLARAEPWDFATGDSHHFWLQDRSSGAYRQVTANLVYETPHAYWFAEPFLGVDGRTVHNVAEQFETEIYPVSRHYFGHEWSPGIDSDPHLIILLAGELGGSVSAYQNSLDEYTRSVFPYSNEMELITVAAEADGLDDPAFACTLAHEFQHVIRWHVNRDEETWLNEALSLLACPLNDLEAAYEALILQAFAGQPDVQLNVWASKPDLAPAQYGAARLFGAYFLQRFGPEAVRSLTSQPHNGLLALDATLASLGAGLDGDELFIDWVIANYLNDSDLAAGRYGYRDLNLPQVVPQTVISAASLPVEVHEAVAQYAADYIILTGPGSFQIDFAGATLVRPVPAAPPSGDYLWWAGRDQESDATLSREFDLGGLDAATLTFSTWYDIDQGYDYAYVSVSVDGQRWTPLAGLTTPAAKPLGLNFGPGYTGRSAGWLQEQLDLTPYAGQTIQIRFDYITDDGPLGPGFLLDDIAIPELGYTHDAESGDDGWSAAGFLRLANLLPQNWSLQLITQSDNGPAVERLQLTPAHNGRWTVDLGPGESAALVIAGLTRDTAEAADYWLRVANPAG